MRPTFHLTPPSGWCNDPNGVIFFRGRYHCFYQHHPHDTRWGPMHWGHASSTDLLSWDHHPIALTPDQPYEAHPTAGGCFSGSAIEHDGKLALLYTAHSHRDNAEFESQCLATSDDGLRFTKHAGNPVILPEHLPAGDRRDPKIFRKGDRYFMVLGTRTDSRGAAALFESSDLVRWSDRGILCHTEGTMCECPDFFELDGQHVLIYSPIGRQPRRVMAVVGDFSYDTLRFTARSSHPLDLGPDFYAPQTTPDDRGRRVLIGWLGNWQADCPPSMRQAGFAWSMTLPRTLRIAGDRVVSTIVEPPGLAHDLPLVPGKPLTLDGSDLSLELSPDRRQLIARQTIVHRGVSTPRETIIELPDASPIRRVRAIRDAQTLELQINDQWPAAFAIWS